MSGGLFDDNPLPDDDYLDGIYDEESEEEANELGADYHVQTELTDTPDISRASSPGNNPVSNAKNNSNPRIAKIKRMPQSLQKRGISTMLITRTDGKQVLFVNPNA